MSQEEAAIRETYEETTIKISSPRLVYKETSTEYGVLQHIYLCQYVSGEPQLLVGSEEEISSLNSENTYQPQWIDFEKLIKERGEMAFITDRLLDEMIKSKPQSFNHNVIAWTS